ncbi:hypothetical protein AB0K21_13100 [Streptosporangium sp. NPDC049248]|uniref:hypothetical protein n=1 Tax=Streptosporangium sp. NPDC049248 TaxID=3155651 RepID=UPI003427996E
MKATLGSSTSPDLHFKERSMRKVFLGSAALLLLAVIAQFYLSTFGAFERPTPSPGASSAITPHAINGVAVIPALSLITAIVAAAARAGSKMIWLSLVPLAVVLGQLFVIFPLVELSGATKEQTNTFAHIVFGFHAVLGLVLLWASVVIFREARALASTAAHARGRTPHLVSSSF